MAKEHKDFKEKPIFGKAGGGKQGKFGDGGGKKNAGHGHGMKGAKKGK